MPFFQRSPLVSLFYFDEGPHDAPAILLIHGLTCDLHDWSWQVPFLLKLGFRVISMDIRGHGKSSAPPPSGVLAWPGPNADDSVIDYYPQTCAYDAAALLNHLNINKVIVIGGDLITYYLAVTHPSLVRAIVGIDPIHRWDNSVREANASFFDDPKQVTEKLIFFFELSYPADAPKWLKTWHIRRAREMDDNVLYAAAWGGWGDTENGLGRKEVAVREYSGKLKCPRLTLGVDEEAVHVDRDELPKGSEFDETVIVAGKGHWFHQLGSEKFNGILEKWFRKIGALPKRV